MYFNLIFPVCQQMIIPEEPKWNTPEKKYNSYEKLESDFAEGTVHPNDLKKSMTIHINNLLDPVRDYFNKNKDAKRLAKLVKGYRK